MLISLLERYCIVKKIVYSKIFSYYMTVVTVYTSLMTRNPLQNEFSFEERILSQNLVMRCYEYRKLCIKTWVECGFRIEIIIQSVF